MVVPFANDGASDASNVVREISVTCKQRQYSCFSSVIRSDFN